MPKPLRIATWNINSVRLRRPLLTELVAALDPDVLCLQETKCPDELFPLEEIRARASRISPTRGMKGYNGVAVLSRIPLRHRADDAGLVRQGRLPAPGGGSSTRRAGRSSCMISTCRPAAIRRTARTNPKFAHKLDFVAEATQWSAARGPDAHRDGRRPQHRPAGA